MTSLWRDLRHALRFLRLSPGFTFVAVLTLALGIGANTAIFQLIDSIRLRTIPVKKPQELGTIRIADRQWGSGQFSSQYSQLTFAMWEQIRKRQEGFAEIAVWSDAVQSGHRRRGPHSKRHPCQRRFLSPPWRPADSGEAAWSGG